MSVYNIIPGIYLLQGFLVSLWLQHSPQHLNGHPFYSAIRGPSCLISSAIYEYIYGNQCFLYPSARITGPKVSFLERAPIYKCHLCRLSPIYSRVVNIIKCQLQYYWFWWKKVTLSNITSTNVHLIFFEIIKNMLWLAYSPLNILFLKVISDFIRELRC